MKLNGVFFNALASFSVRLPLLRALHVGDRVLFGCHDYVVKLLAGCPALEDLVLESTYNDACGGVVCAEGNFELSLKHLTRAKIGFSWKERCLKSMLLIFQALSHVRCLSLSPCTVAVVTSVVVSMFVARYCTDLVHCFGCGSGMGVFVVVNSGNKKDLCFTSKTNELEGRKIPRRGMCVHGQLFWERQWTTPHQ
ncbi:hypothetical protein LR48_Vigan03g130800 [Vigna angularis]|uniref:FBD domain-containing protein n=1 Tax=Phaseolus angularis TaxID=3914 RepID=A0A0L9U560_PHAAN|nr:hypothetical protein LR48_Vigan03g130800 [Vigna angularis]